MQLIFQETDLAPGLHSMSVEISEGTPKCFLMSGLTKPTKTGYWKVCPSWLLVKVLLVTRKERKLQKTPKLRTTQRTKIQNQIPGESNKKKIDQSDSFLPYKVLAYETVFFFTCGLNKWEINYHEFWE